MKSLLRNLALSGLAVLSFLACAAPSMGWAATYPNRSITLIVPYLPGGWVEMVTRPFAESMSKDLGVPVVLSLMPGAAGTIGATKAMQSKPDGYTIYVATDVLFSYNTLLRKVRYTLDDANPIYGVGQSTALLVTSKKQTKYQTFEEMMEYCKAHPKEITLGTSGLNNIFAVKALQLEKAFGCQVQIVPFDGALAISNAVVSGHVEAGFTEYTRNSEQLPLLFMSPKNDFFPGVRDFADVGHPEVLGALKMVMYGPPKLPEQIRLRLEAAAEKAAEDPTFQRTLATFSAVPYKRKKDAILKDMKNDQAVVKKMIEEGLLTPEQ